MNAGGSVIIISVLPGPSDQGPAGLLEAPVVLVGGVEGADSSLGGTGYLAICGD